MRTTKIEWTERTWNPVTGCNKISEGCRHCYAEMMTRRLFAMGHPKYEIAGGSLEFEGEDLTELKTFERARQILTKRAKRMAEYFESRVIPPNAWIGVTVENRNAIERIDSIRHLDAKVKFLSCEPLLEDLGELELDGINWIIVGGESGVSARPMNEKWVVNIMNQAHQLNIPFFFKQWGTWGCDGIKRNKRANGKLLLGQVIQEYPFNINI